MKRSLLSILFIILTAMLASSIAVPALAQEPDLTWTGAGTAESPYQVTSKEHLAAIATKGLDKHYKLMNNITDVADWDKDKSIGTSDTPFTGTFDGDGHVITMNSNCSFSLFNYIGNSNNKTATVKNLGVAGSLKGSLNIGGIAIDNYGTIKQCYTNATIESGGIAGGIAVSNKGTIQNSYSSATINGKSNGGGIAAANSGTIQNCYSTGAVTVTVKTTSANAGGIVGTNSGSISNCYATGSVSGNTAAGGIAGENNSNKETDVTATIQNCIALNTSISGTSKGKIAGTNESGTLTDNYASPNISGEWTEGGNNGTALTAENFTGKGANAGAFTGWTETDWDFSNIANLPTLQGFSSNAPAQPTITRPVIEATLIKEIKSATDLATFRDAVNNGETYKDETVTLAATFAVTNWAEGIGSSNKPFLGTFDGGGHVITLTGSTSLFGQIGKNGEATATVKNLGVKAEITADNGYIGGIVGQNFGIIQNCYTEGAITNENAGSYTGGIVGNSTSNSTIQNCYSTASCTSKSTAGGIAGSNLGKILQCYATGAIKGEGSTGGIVGTYSATPTIKYCIALNTSISGTTKGRIIGSLSTPSNLSNNHASPLLPCTSSDSGKDGANLTKENFITPTTATGAFANWPTGNDGWDLTTASLPTLEVFKDESNPQPAKGITRVSKLLILNIATADDLIKFRDAVNSGETYKDLTVTLTASFSVTGWTEDIGSNDKPFLGTFDGGGYVITLTGSTSLFGYIGNPSNKTGLVKNLGVKATITPSLDNTGAIVRLNYGKIQNCFTEGSITSTDRGNPGGIAGKNEGTIEDCYSTASITAATSCAGGIVGYNNDGSTIQRCYATGAITNTGTYATAGGIAGNNSNGAINNCIALNTSITGYIAGRITGQQGGSNLSGNYASPLIPGEWTGKGATYLNGADLTTANFITPTGATDAFTNWPTGDTGWDLTTDKLPTLKGFKSDQPVKDITRVSRLLIFDIATADDLAKFRDIVNGGETYEEKTVTLKGDITVEEWEEEKGIGANYTKPFLGTFDGAGRVITLTGKTSLFTTLGKSGNGKGTVQNLGVKVKIETTESISTGGIVSTNYGTVKQCYTTGSITNDESSSWAGGIVGQNHGTVQDCYSTVSITVKEGAGGIVQINKGTIERCFATGAISGGGDPIGGIEGETNDGTITQCIALNKSITTTGSGSLGRISGENEGTLTTNYASPLIPGDDGTNLTDDTFIDKGANEGAFTGWLATAWDFGDNSCLPKLMTTGLATDIVIGGQGDGSGNMPTRADFLEEIIKISTAVTYDADTHKDKPIHVLNNGIFTVNAEGASFKKLTIDEGGQVVAQEAFTCGQLLAPRTLGYKWTAYGSPVEMKAVTTSAQTFHRLIGYTQTSTNSQVWGSSGSSGPATSYEISDRYLIATDANNVSVTLTAPISGNTPVSIPADVAPKTGAALYNGIFLFCQNPTLHNVEIPGAYILNTDGTRFEQVEAGKVAIVKPFQSYIVANAATTNALKSLRVGEMPTGNEQIVNSGFRIWGANGQLHLSADSASRVSIYTPSGQLLRTFTLTGEQTVTLGSGIYFVHSNNITYKVSL